jgi:hypothetical protein
VGLLDNKYLSITIGDVEIDLSRESVGDPTKPEHNIVSVIRGGESNPFTLDEDFINSFSCEMASLLPNNFSITVKDVLLAKVANVNNASGTTGTNSADAMLLSASFGTKISLGELPILKDFIPEGIPFSIDGCQITMASSGISPGSCNAINQLLPDGVSPLPTLIHDGLNASATLTIGDTVAILSLKNTQVANNSTSNNSTTTSSTNASSNKGTTNVNKQIGPVNISSFGLQLKDGTIELSISGSLCLGPLELDFIGFEVSTPIDTFNPSVSLQGLGVDINKAPLSIQGLLMKNSINIPTADANGNISTTTIDGYEGGISISYANYALTAIGSYAKLPDNTNSFFLYGFLAAPLGGPPICFITGVAAGFGYNRTLLLPDPQHISTYPLIAPVISNTAMHFDDMNKQFMPTEGAFWGAVGIRAESFKMVENFVLLIIRFFEQLEIDIIGVSNMVFPIPKDGDATPPLAKIGIGLIARIIPARGIMSINGAFLPNSYVLNPMATISGGFAVLTIFKDQHSGTWKNAQEGDFVVTLGGYASNFSPQPYYPQVPRLELNWQVSSNLSLQAEAYFAITPLTLMAGGYLKANFNSGGDFSIQVYFKVGADFIIYWKPYHYSADIYADLSVTATINVDLWLFTIHASVDFDLSADMNIWGPSFSGNASVRVHVLVSFTVSVSFGDASQAILPIDLNEFQKSFLPQSENTIALSISNGLVASQSSADLNVVNAKELVFSCTSAIPIKQISGLIAPPIPNQDFGIKPMAMQTKQFSLSQLNISVYENTSLLQASEIDSRFNVSFKTKNLPSALWDSASYINGTIVGSTDNALINDLLTGIEVSTISTVSTNNFIVQKDKFDTIYTIPVQIPADFSYDTNYN